MESVDGYIPLLFPKGGSSETTRSSHMCASTWSCSRGGFSTKIYLKTVRQVFLECRPFAETSCWLAR